MPSAPALALDLLQRLLVYDPTTRYDVQNTLKHQFLGKYHDSDSIYEKPCIPVFNFDFEKQVRHTMAKTGKRLHDAP